MNADNFTLSFSYHRDAANAVLAPTPIPVQTEQPVNTDPPTSWVFAGVLLILLILMLYKSIKRSILRILNSNKAAGSKKK